MNYLIRLFYFLRLRTLVNNLQRRLKGEHKLSKSKLIKVKTPQEVVDYAKLNGYKWRPDATRVGKYKLPLDWVTHPEVFQWKLEQDPFPEGEGDCDDIHGWYAHCFAKISSVERVARVSTVWKGGGHTTCVYKQDGQWYHCNYTIKKIDDPNDAPADVLAWASKKRDGEELKLVFYVFEDLDFRLLAVSPRGKIEP